MRTVRRLYFYAIATVSLEVVIWGVIGLLRTFINNPIGGQANLLAGSLSLILVGVPVFLIHWWVAQRGALRDPEDRAARERSLFLYGVLLGVLIPIVQNGLAISNRLVLEILGLQWAPLVGKGQTWGDNLIAMAVNAGAAAYFLNILRADWKANPPGNSLADVRRLYRFVWTIYGLGIAVLGVQQVLRYILYSPGGITGSVSFFLADGLGLLIVGAPLWVGSWLVLQKASMQAGERESMLRLVVLYLLALAGVGTVLTSAGIVLYDLLGWLLGSTQTFTGFLQAISRPLSVAIPLGGVWAYYSRRLRMDIEGLPEQPRRAGLRRLYTYILAAFGLGATFFGLNQLLSFIVNAAITQQIGSDALRAQLSTALSTLIVGFPLWWATWRPMQLEAGQLDDAGDYARRSLVRKSYLYLALYAGVIGVMGTAGEAIYLVINKLMGSPTFNLAQSVLNALQSLVLFALWLAYHIRVLRRDGRLAEQTLAERHQQFPVLVIDPNDGSFAREITEALRRFTPHIPVTVQALQQGLPETGTPAVKAVILPSSLATHPPEALRAWLADFGGQHLVVPAVEEGWQWVGTTAKTNRERAQQVAHVVRQMAEDQPVRISPPASAWAIVGIVLGGLFALEMVLVLVALIVSQLQR